MTPGTGPRFEPHDGSELAPRVRRLEDWAGRHDQWSYQTARDGDSRAEGYETRLGALEEKMTRVLASIGEHRLKWGIVAWVVGVAVAVIVARVAGR